MRGRWFAAVLILALVIGVGWEVMQFMAPSTLPPPPMPPPAAPPIATPVAKPAVVPAPVSSPAPRPIPAPKSGKKHPAPPVLQKAPVVVPHVSKPPTPTRYVPSPPPPREWKGNSDTAITHSGQITIRTEQQWNHFWAEHHPHEVSPDIDFSRQMVVGVFLGRRPADGFSVQITGTRTLPDVLWIDYTEYAPPPGTFQMGIDAYPYDIQVIPRSALPVKFRPLTAQYLPDTSISRSSGTR